MARIDRRPEQKSHQGGSSLLDTGLTAEQAAAALDDQAATAGWYVLGNLEGGEFGETVNEEEIWNEADEIVTVNHSEEAFEIGNTLLSTDTPTMRLMNYLADGGFFPMRYPLPAGVDAEGNRLYQLWGFHNARVIRDGWTMNTGKGEARKRPFTVKAYKRQGQPLYVVETVQLDDQTNWPPSLDAFGDDVFAPAV